MALGVTEIPWSIGLALMFVPITYFMFGFQAAAGPFFTYFLATVLMGLYYAYIGLYFVAVLPNLPLASILAGVTVSFSILFAGEWGATLIFLVFFFHDCNRPSSHPTIISI